MESPDKRLTELVDILKSWIPRRTERGNLSRDFWMPDHSCGVCYECDSQFTIFNRRHHCRLCGRIFCAKCTANSIPAPIGDPKGGREERDHIRVCNFCFKQWEQERVTVDNGMRLSSPGLTPSPSTTSLASTKSSLTGNSSITVGSSTPNSTGSFQHVPYDSGLSLGLSNQTEVGGEKAKMASGRNGVSVADIGDPSPNKFEYTMTRSDDEDDEYHLYRSDSKLKHFQPRPDEYFGQVEFGDFNNDYRSHKVHPTGENFDHSDLSFPTHETPDSQDSVTTVNLGEEEGSHYNGEGCDATIYRVENAESEPVDFENNGLLWLPPEPEDKEDDREAAVLFDDDDDDGTGEWRQLRSSNSFGSGEYRNRDRSNEEHKKAMKNVVEGHFRALVAQLLQVENLPMGEEDKENWLDVITSLSWEAATLLKPDTSKGGGMDPAGYVKVKCIACGRRSESVVIKGVVCKKNVAHRRMSSKIKTPRFLILGGALEYQRVSNHLSSFDTLLQQEMDHLKMAVAKIDAHHPNVLLVEKSVSRYAQEYLLAKDIALVLNIKRPLLERIARCTGAQIIPSIDHLTSQKLGYSEMFHVEKYLEEHGSAGHGGKKLVKTLMFFEGCPKPFGCTILLKGANGDELKKVKHVVQYGIFAAYHLALETSFLADEGASLPELPLKSPITVALPDKPSSFDPSISTIPGFVTPTSSRPHSDSVFHKSDEDFKSYQSVGNIEELMGVNSQSPKILNSLIPNTVSALFRSSSSCNDLKQLSCKKDTRISDSSQQIKTDTPVSNTCFDLSPNGFEEKKFCKIINHETLDGHIFGDQAAETREVMANNAKIIGNQSCMLDVVPLNNNYLQEERASGREEFPPSPSDHQSILVSLSTRCVWKGTVCERAHLFRIKYYGNFDKPLGRFLRDHLFDQSYQCRSCGMPSDAHVHCYTHRQGSLTISVKKLLELPLPGEREDKIWMWHRCLKCPRNNGFPPATRRVVMSDAAWGLSFGKFLELSFSNHAAASRVASCGHSLHRDCLRFYGFGNMVACFRYASIDVHSVFLPPHKLDFNYQLQDWIQKEANEVAERAELLFSEVLNAIYQIQLKSDGLFNSGSKVSVLRRHIIELETMLQKEKAEFEESLQRALDKEPKNGQPAVDILEINRLRRQLLFHSYIWDQRLIYAAGLDNGQHEELSSFLMKHKEKPTSIEKLMEVNLIARPRIISSGDTLPDPNTDVLKEILSPLGNEGGRTGPDHNIGKENNDLLESLEAGGPVRRALSEGQFPIMTNLSDTLDAAWTGETKPASLKSHENGFPLSSSLSLDSATAVESTTVSINPEDKGQKEVAQTIHTMPAKVPNHVNNTMSGTGTPFLSFYHSFDKNFSSSNTKLDYFGEYNPIYVSSFRELERQGGARLLLPVGITDTVIPVYDDEPTSIISYTLVSPDYHIKMSDERERLNSTDSSTSAQLYDSGISHPFQSFDEISQDSFKSFGSTEDSLLSMSISSGSRSSRGLDPPSYTKPMDVRVSFTDNSTQGKVKYMVTCYHAKRFEALRRTCCPSELDYIRSLSRCRKWGAQGGKSNVFFAKTLDDRFIIKQVTKTELESFIKFAPEYFKYLSESIATGSPTCLAKILGIYQVTTKHLKGGKESRMDVLVMENLLFGRNLTRLYDLKGSSRSRYNPDSSGANKVLLDQNLIEAMPTSPIFVGNKAKRVLERAVWNDTSFLASVDVMDYSLLVGVDEEKHELVLGIIDFMRQYTWDKHLETWVKASGILGGPKNTSPTVISPKQYKKRFRKAMSAYFLMVPDQWSPPTIIPSASQSDLNEENSQNLSLE